MLRRRLWRVIRQRAVKLALPPALPYHNQVMVYESCCGGFTISQDSVFLPSPLVLKCSALSSVTRSVRFSVIHACEQGLSFGKTTVTCIRCVG